MRDKRYIALYLVTFLMSLAFAFRVLPTILIENELGWAIPMTAILNGVFILEIWISLLGYKGMWKYFESKDKIVFFFAMTVFLTLLTFTEKVQLSRGAEILITLAGLLLGWLIIHFFGSTNMKNALTLHPSMRQENSDKEESK